MTVRTWTARYSIVDGQVRQEGPWLGSFARRPPDDEEWTLHVLVEPAARGSEDICGQLVEVMGRLFQREGLSLTGALQRSLAAAHENLRDWNRKSLPEHRVGVGVSCLIVRGLAAYLAQAGPSLAYAYHNGELRKIAPTEPAAAGPLGQADDLRPELTAFAFTPGDMLLLVSSDLARLADLQTLVGVLDRGPDDALAELYLLTRDSSDFSALLVACFDRPEEAPPPPPLPFEEDARGPASGESRATFEQNGGQAVASPISTLPRPGPALDTRPGPPPSSSGPTYLPGFEVENAIRNGGNGGGPSARHGAASVAERAGPLQRASVVARGPGAAIAPVRASTPPPRYNFRRTTTSRVPELNGAWLLVALAGLIGFISLLAYCTLTGSGSSGGAGGEYQTFLSEARESYRSAQLAEDPAVQADFLSAALSSLASAEAVSPGESDAAALRSDITSQLAAVESVFDLGDLGAVADLSALIDGSDLRVVTGAGAVFVLDREGGRVIAVDPAGEGEPALVFEAGQLAGVVKAGEPQAIAWSDGDEANPARLLIIDSNRHLFAYAPGGSAAPVVLRGAGEWGSMDGIASYNGNLYVLDGRAGQVWRYLPTESGYDSERTGVLEDETDLGGAVELWVESEVLILTREGQVRRFVSGVEEPLTLTGLDRGLAAPSSLAGDGNGGILLTDRSTGRLLLFDAGGALTRQMVSASFAPGLRAAAIDPPSGRLFIVAGKALFAAYLPSP